MSKFKVGDKVVGNMSASKRYTITKEGYAGTVTGVFSSGSIMLNNSYLVNEQCFDLASPANHSIHITCTDNKTTHAVKKVDGKIVARSTAVCCPSDTFDFAVGAQLAFNRLVHGADHHPADVAMRPKQPKREPAKLYCVAESHPGKRLTKGKIYKTDANGYITYDDGTTSTYEHGSDGWKNNITGISSRLVPLVSRPAEVGEWIYIKNKIGGSGYGVGDIGKVEKLSFFHGDVCAFGGEYIDRMEYLVLDGYKPEPEPEKAEPEYYSGKVVCVAGSNGFTVGKPYEFKNGVVVDDDGDVRPSNGDRKITSLSDTYLRDWENKFIEFKGE